MPQTTLRAHLRELEGIEAIERQGHDDVPGVIQFALTEAGEDLLYVVAALERWLSETPDGPLDFASDAGRAAIKALVGGWSSTVLHSLAASPASLSELASDIRSVSYPSVERRLSAMRIAGQVEACPGDGRGTPYAVTEWLRQGIGPIAAAVHWEHDHLAGRSASMTRLDAEAAFQLALPLLRTESALEGSCRMTMEVNGRETGLAGATIHVKRGRVRSCTPSLEQRADAWATGSPPAWSGAMVGPGPDRLETGGRRRLVTALLSGLRQPLLAPAAP